MISSLKILVYSIGCLLDLIYPSRHVPIYLAVSGFSDVISSQAFHNFQTPYMLVSIYSLRLYLTSSSRNILDETKSNFAGQTVDKDIGSNRPEDGASGGKLTDRVDELLTGSGNGEAATTEKARSLDNQGMKVGADYEGVDKHDLAASKQP